MSNPVSLKELSSKITALSMALKEAMRYTAQALPHLQSSMNAIEQQLTSEFAAIERLAEAELLTGGGPGAAILRRAQPHRSLEDQLPAIKGEYISTDFIDHYLAAIDLSGTDRSESWVFGNPNEGLAATESLKSIHSLHGDVDKWIEGLYRGTELSSYSGLTLIARVGGVYGTFVLISKTATRFYTYVEAEGCWVRHHCPQYVSQLELEEAVKRVLENIGVELTTTLTPETMFKHIEALVESKNIPLAEQMHPLSKHTYPYGRTPAPHTLPKFRHYKTDDCEAFTMRRGVYTYQLIHRASDNVYRLLTDIPRRDSYERLSIPMLKQILLSYERAVAEADEEVVVTDTVSATTHGAYRES